MDSSFTHIRPRFLFAVPYKKQEVLDRIAKLLEQTPDYVEGQIVDNHIILDIVGKELHFWSPHLNFRVEEDEDSPNVSVVLGHIGPRPTVWTLFVFFYFVIGIIGFIITSNGVSKYLMDGSFHYTLLGLPIAAIIMLSAFKAGKMGERLGASQIEQLKQFIRDALNMGK